MQQPYSIRNIINYRQLDWKYSDDFLFLTDIPAAFESFIFTPDYYSYGIISKGQLVLELDGVLFEVDNRNQSFLIYRPQQKLRIVSITPGTEGSFILFNQKFINQLDKTTRYLISTPLLEEKFGTYFPLSETDYDYLRNIFSKVFDLLYLLPEERWETSAHKLVLFLLTETDALLSLYSEASQKIHFSRGTHILNEFIQLVSENYMQYQSIDFYVEKLHISSNYLHKLVQKQLNNTPLSLIHKAILEGAISLLNQPELNISEIADRLSFNDVSAFSKFFKKKMHQSPTEYRSQILTAITSTEITK